MTPSNQHIRKICFDSGQEGPHLLITAGVHGDEYEPMLAVSQLRKALHQELALARGKLTLVPVVNEPAFARGARTGEDGKDLARTCPGQADGSPTEKIAHEISALIRTADFFIDMHTGGDLFDIHPLAGYMLSADPVVLDQQRHMADAFDLPVVWGTSPHLEGRTLSIARDAGVPAIYTEYGGGGSCKPQIVEALKSGCLNVMRYLGMLPGAVPKTTKTTKTKYVVEDHRPASGHLQIMHPSPMTGIFMPCVKLGQMVDSRQLIGTVFDPHSNENAAIRASEEGVLFLLRSAGLVNTGEATAGILPITQPGKITIT